MQERFQRGEALRLAGFVGADRAALLPSVNVAS